MSTNCPPSLSCKAAPESYFTGILLSLALLYTLPRVQLSKGQPFFLKFSRKVGSFILELRNNLF